MTFASNELSVDSGRPIELLQITYSQEQWNYTTAEVPITYGGSTYEPLPITRGKIQPTGDASKASLTFSVPHDTPVGDLFRVRPPSEIVTVTLFGEHYLDNDFQTLWKGRITSVDWRTPWLDLNCESVFSSLRRIGLRRRYGAQCGHVLYESKCAVDRNAFRLTGQVTLINGATLTMPASGSATSGYYAGGYAVWISDTTGAVERQMIIGSASGNIVLSSAPSGLAEGMIIDIFPGCDHFLSTCDTKFGNSLNFGGTPFIPQKNPFSGSTIY